MPSACFGNSRSYTRRSRRRLPNRIPFPARTSSGKSMIIHILQQFRSDSSIILRIIRRISYSRRFRSKSLLTSIFLCSQMYAYLINSSFRYRFVKKFLGFHYSLVLPTMKKKKTF